MIQSKNFTSILTLIMGMISVSVFLTGCNDLECNSGLTPTDIYGYYIFEDTSGRGIEYSNPDHELIQFFKYNSDEQTITLKLKSVSKPGLPMPENLIIYYYMAGLEADPYVLRYYNTARLNELHSEGFYHILSDYEDGEPVIKIDLMTNQTGKTRYIELFIVSDPTEYELIKADKHDHYIDEDFKVACGGYVAIEQLPNTDEPESFNLKAQYKGRDYQTEASIDEEGNLIFANPEYAELMQTIDAAPNVEMMILNSETFYYYDADDVSDNRPYHDIMALKPGVRSTRATGFEDFEYSDLGYVALYDNDHFEGKHISKGLDNFHFTWNLPNLKDYDMNDKVTSIATLFHSDDPLVCTVLTIWDDTDYNNGDDNRKKQRVSIVACSQAPFVAVDDLKKVKKIGSSKSWNDCISSISFHFEYIDRLLLDY